MDKAASFARELEERTTWFGVPTVHVRKRTRDGKARHCWRQDIKLRFSVGFNLQEIAVERAMNGTSRYDKGEE